jgi:hypothetical protein
MKYINNAFSPSMVDLAKFSVSFEEITREQFEEEKKGAISVVGHQNTAEALNVKFNRTTLKLKNGDVLIIAQLLGGRLPEGTTPITEMMEFKFLKVVIL